MNPHQKSNPMSRRAFLATVGTASAAMLAGPARAALTPDHNPAPLSSLAAMKAAVGSEFYLQGPDGKIRASLDHIASESVHGPIQQFSAHFTIKSHGDHVLPQQLYTLTSKRLGNLDLFMVPTNDGPTRSMIVTFCQLI